MNDILKEVYDELAFEKVNLTEKDFSTSYLGRCGTYYSYLKSANKKASIGVKLKLWKKLEDDKRGFEARLVGEDRKLSKYNLMEWVELHSRLSAKVFEDIVATA